METILIIGGTGTLGHKLTEALASDYKIVVFSRDEDKQWAMRQKFKDTNVRFQIGCVRNPQRVRQALLYSDPTYVIAAAAMKHIDLCESNIDECIDTNILGAQNIADSVHDLTASGSLQKLEGLVYVSTDKACNPINAYGMCKSLAEKIMINKSQCIGDRPRLVNVRYGNVIDSRGSLLPLYKSIANDPAKEFFPVTHRDMTRFFMTADESVQLIKKAMFGGRPGDTYIPKLRSYKIIDIAEAFSQRYGKPVKITGIRPREKIHEVLMSEEESHHVLEQDDVFIVRPSHENSADANGAQHSSLDFLYGKKVPDGIL